MMSTWIRSLYTVHIRINIILDAISPFLILNIIGIRFESIDFTYEWKNLVINAC